MVDDDDDDDDGGADGPTGSSVEIGEVENGKESSMREEPIPCI